MRAFNLAGSDHLHAKSAGKGSTPARSARIRPSPTAPAIGAPPLPAPAHICTRTMLVPLARNARVGRLPSRPGITPRSAKPSRRLTKKFSMYLAASLGLINIKSPQ